MKSGDIINIIGSARTSGKGAKTSARLLYKSIPIFEREGYAHLNLAKLGKLLKVDRTLLAHYFVSLDNLFFLVFRAIAAEVQTYVVSEVDKVPQGQKLIAYGVSQIECFKQHPQYLNIWGQFLLVMLSNQKAKAHFDEALKIGRSRIQAMICQYRPDFSSKQADSLAIDLQAKIFGPLFFSLIYEPYDLNRAKKQWITEIESLSIQ